MNRNYYCKVNSQKEADELLKKLRDIGETTNDKYIYITNWQYIVYGENTAWTLSNIEIFKEEFEDKIEVSASELIDYVTGKKLDRYTLLKEARRRYPVGTKFRCPAGIGVTGIHKIEIEDKIKFYGIYSNNIDILGKGYVYYNNQWAEIVKEPKVETKFEKGKWYKYDNWYIKFNTLDSSGIWLSSEQIDCDRNYNKRERIFGGKESYNTKILLTDLSEIQQYLPDGHPDKFTTLITKEKFILPEKWCIKSTDEADKTLIKWRGGAYFNRPAYLCSDKYWISEDISKAYTEITFDQFKKYVLKQEVKEEVKSMKEWSVGSYAVALKNEVNSFSTRKGDIYLIKKDQSADNLTNKNTGLIFLLPRDPKEFKWFPTLQEAQKFSDELLGKSKTSLRVEDLVKGEIYSGKITISNGDVIFKPNECELYSNSPYVLPNSFHKANNPNNATSIKPATPLEKKWLRTCIKQDKFIPKEDLDKYDDEGNLMKNGGYLEYYECIKPELWKNTIKSNNGNLIFSGNFITISGSTVEYEYLHQPGHFKISTKFAYDAQFKKDEKFKDGDWLVYSKHCASIPIKIGDIKQMIKGKFGSLVIYGYEDLSQYFRKALPHEIPVENSVKQYPYTPEESIKLDFEVKWKDPRYIGGVDSITATGWGIYEQMKKQPIQSRKTPDLIDKSKVEVKIKRTKVKQIKL